MKPFITIKDSDIFEDPLEEPKEYVTRPTAKGLVFDADGNMALIEARDHYGLPGGGVESGENFEQALMREIDEEIGCKINIVSIVCNTEQYRAEDAKKYETTYFIAKVVGEKGMQTSEQEDEQNKEILWLTKETALKILKEQINTTPKDNYPAQFNIRTHLAAVEKYCKENHENK